MARATGLVRGAGAGKFGEHRTKRTTTALKEQGAHRDGFNIMQVKERSGGIGFPLKLRDPVIGHQGAVAHREADWSPEMSLGGECKTGPAHSE